MNIILVEYGLNSIKKKYLKLKSKDRYFKALKTCSDGYKGADNAMKEFGKQRFASGGGFESKTPKEIIILGKHRDWFAEQLVELGKDDRAPYKN